MKKLDQIFDNNRAGVRRVKKNDPEFFERLSHQQAPKYLWIGCSDSRVPANDIVGLLPGELFVHRNVANIVVHTDLNCLSVVQFAVDVLKVEHVIVCGHYGCSGVRAALRGDKIGLSDNWLRHVQDVREKHEALIEGITSEESKHNRLCELNVIEQVVNVNQTTIIRDARERGQIVGVHGWVYGLQDGLIHDLEVSATNAAELQEGYRKAVKRL